MSYREWSDLVATHPQSRVMIAQFEQADPIPLAVTHLSKVRELIEELTPEGDFALAEGGALEVVVAFEKAEDALRIGDLLFAAPAAVDRDGFPRIFRYGVRVSKAPAPGWQRTLRAQVNRLVS